MIGKKKQKKKKKQPLGDAVSSVVKPSTEETDIEVKQFIKESPVAIWGLVLTNVSFSPPSAFQEVP